MTERLEAHSREATILKEKAEQAAKVKAEFLAQMVWLNYTHLSCMCLFFLEVMQEHRSPLDPKVVGASVRVRAHTGAPSRTLPRFLYAHTDGDMHTHTPSLLTYQCSPTSFALRWCYVALVSSFTSLVLFSSPWPVHAFSCIRWRMHWK